MSNEAAVSVMARLDRVIEGWLMILLMDWLINVYRFFAFEPGLDLGYLVHGVVVLVGAVLVTGDVPVLRWMGAPVRG